MGIPSYFKHILDRYPRLLKPVGPDFKCDVLLVDFNCLIYGCIRGPKMPPYSHSERDAWEAAAIRAVEEYVVHIWRSAGQPRQVLFAVDGVVPFAKMRQQRMRRFKSVWLATKERELGARSGESWDTNAITPGTEFMERLAAALRRLAAARPGWTVSAADEAGEGEQKCMAWVRAAGDSLAGKRVCVYGLDADLIVLSLLHAVSGPATTDWRILRERMEFGSVVDAEFLTLHVNGLAEVLWPEQTTRIASALSYVGGMSLLGNDFLPHSIGLNIRNGGHDALLRALKGAQLVDPATCQTNREALLTILDAWALTEESDIVAAFQRKYSGRGPPPRTDVERIMRPVQNLPLEWYVESGMWKKQGTQLCEGWRDTYYRHIGALGQADIWHMCEVWCEGLQWILDYYTGRKPVSYDWLYPWSHPPLWSDLATYVRAKSVLPLAPAPISPPVQPQEQLTLVLPLESWGLIRDSHLRAIPTALRAFWPRAFGFESLGKRWFWECEAEVPLLTPARLRAALSCGTDCKREA